MIGGTGGLLGPDLSSIARERTLFEIEQSLTEPGSSVARGYEAVKVKLRDGRALDGIAKNESNFDLQLQDRAGKLHLLRRSDVATIERGKSLMPPVVSSVENQQNLVAFLSRLGGSTVTTGAADASHQAVDFKRLVQSATQGDWPTYNGNFQGNRHSTLQQIHRGNIAGLAPRWMFPIPGAERLQVTPVVIDG